MAGLADALQGYFYSDPTSAAVQTPQQVQQQQSLADALLRSGSDYSPVGSPWAGAARLAQGLAGAIGSYKAGQAQRLGQANAAADFGNALGSDPGQQNIPATPGQTTPALQTSDQRNDAISDAEDAGMSPQAALAAALGATGSPVSGNPGLATALGAPPAGGGTPRGLRNNNPGNLEANAWTSSLPGYAGTDGRFAIFNSPGAGEAALDRNLQSYGARGIQTPLAIASTWAPGSEAGNNPSAYGATIARTLGVGLNDPVNMSDPATRAKIAQAISLVENGRASAVAPPVAANGTVTGSPAPGVTASLSAYPSPVAAAGATPQPGGPQGAGAGGPPAPAPSQADIAQLRTAMQPQAGGGGGIISPANAAQPYASPALAMASGLTPPAAWSDGLTPLAAPWGVPLRTNAGGAVSPPATGAVPLPPVRPPGLGGAPAAPVPSPAPSAPSPAPANPGGSGVSAPPSAPAPQPAFHPDVQGLLNVLSDPWATPAQQQIAQQLLSAQMPTPPTFGVIGKDAAGNEQYGWISPKTMTITPANSGVGVGGAGGPLPAPGAAPGAPAAAGAPAGGSNPAQPPAQPATVAGAVNMGAANGLTPQGDTYLAGMEGQGGASAIVARQARAIINGQAPLPEANAATKPIDVAVRDAVFRAAPSFNSSLAAARVDTVKSFADKTTPTAAGGMILAANTGLHHLNALADSAAQLNNGGSPGLNAVTNTAKEWWEGNPALQAYNLNKQALVGELAKIYKGGTPAEAEAQALAESLSPYMTPGEQQAVFGKIATLLQGKTDELQRQWQSAFGPNSAYPVIGAEGQQIIKRFSGGAPGAPGAQPGAPASAQPSISEGRTATNPKTGARMIFRNGAWEPLT